MDEGTIIMAVIACASVLVVLYSVYDGRLRYIDSRQPNISFKLSYSSGRLNLEIMTLFIPGAGRKDGSRALTFNPS